MPDKTDGFEIARQIGGIAEALMQRLFAEYDTLTKDQVREMEDMFWDLQGHAARIRTMAVGDLLAGAETSLAELTAATKQAQKAVKTLDRARDAIKVAAALFDVAGAVATRNTAGLKDAFKLLKDELKDPAKALGKKIVKKVTG